MMKKLAIGLAALVALIGAGVYLAFPPISASHPSLTGASLPPLIPLREFYASSEAKWRFRLSPDGARIAWLEAKNLKPALWVAPLDGDGTEIFHTPDEVRWYAWSANSRYLIYQADRGGFENDVIVSIDTQNPGAEPRAYSFGADVKSFIVASPAGMGAEILIAHNGRDRTKFDLYRLNLDTGETASLEQVTDQSMYWSISRTGEIYARIRTLSGDDWRFEVPDGDGWREVRRGGLEDRLWTVAPGRAPGTVFAVSNHQRDKSALVLLDTETGAEEVLAEHPDVDLSWVEVNPATDEPMMAVFYPGRQERRWFDPSLQAAVEGLAPEGAAVHIVSATQDFSKVLIEIEEETAGYRSILVNVEIGETRDIATPTIAAFRDDLTGMAPVTIEAEDGLTIPAYLTRPRGVTGPAPMVMLIHGGPVARTRWGWNGAHSWLANRGYAVLDVNYRGSDGYGRAFREAAAGEVGLKMHQDIVDARAWAVAEGIADPGRVAVMGGSWGGLKTLMALTETPDLFVAGVNINGVTDIAALAEEAPVYWTGWPPWYRKYIGDLSDPDDLAEIKRRSPLYNVDRIDDPLLVIQGANDVRVVQRQASRLVDALEAAGADFEYILLDGAGHQFNNWGWKTRILINRRIERFLAEHLGGRADGFDYAVLGAHILP